MNYPYVTFYLEAQRAKRNLLHVFKAEPDVPVAGLVLPAPKCAPAQPRKKKADEIAFPFTNVYAPGGICDAIPVAVAPTK